MTSQTSSCLNDNDLLTKYDPKGVCMAGSSSTVQKFNPVLKAVNVLSLPETDPRFGNFLLCAWKQLGIMNEDGTINANIFEYFIEDAVTDCNYFTTEEEKEIAVMSTVERCSIQGTTQEGTAMGLHQCMKVTVPIIGARIVGQRIQNLKYSMA